jgi:lysozyme
MIPGIDVSHWQGSIDWKQVAESGVKFAFIKATEFFLNKTTFFVDDKFKINVQGAKENEILWGAYHFFRTHIDPVIQAKAFCDTVGNFTSLPPVMDLELAGKKGTKLNDMVMSFVTEVERLTKRIPIIYTSGGFWRGYMMYNRRLDTDWARIYPLWLAQYTYLCPAVPYPWAGWEFWQYSDKGRLPGITTHVDLDWFNGSLEELKDKFLRSNRKDISEPEKLNYEDANNIVEDVDDIDFEIPTGVEEDSDSAWLTKYFSGK